MNRILEKNTRSKLILPGLIVSNRATNTREAWRHSMPLLEISDRRNRLNELNDEFEFDHMNF